MGALPELLAPAGDAASLQAALQAGADAVYCGTTQFSMRAAAANLPLGELPALVTRCHDRGARLYLALNTLVLEGEWDLAQDTLDAAAAAAVDAVVASDFGLMAAATERGLEVHASTQLSCANAATIRLLHERFSIARVVPARECSLEDLLAMQAALGGLPIGFELFIHGAQCLAVSGRCFLSEERYGRSANRGACWQPCRRTYRLIDDEDGHEYALEHALGSSTVLSPRDLCCLPFIERLCEAGFAAFKIEGRMRKPEYVHAVVGVYRAALDHWAAHGADAAFAARKPAWLARLGEVFNRGFSDGYYFGQPVADWRALQDSQARLRKYQVGPVLNFYARPCVAEVKIQTTAIACGERLLIIGHTTGVHEQILTSMEIDGAPVTRGEQGQAVGILLTAPVRRGDQVYVLRDSGASPQAASGGAA